MRSCNDKGHAPFGANWPALRKRQRYCGTTASIESGADPQPLERQARGRRASETTLSLLSSLT